MPFSLLPRRKTQPQGVCSPFSTFYSVFKVWNAPWPPMGTWSSHWERLACSSWLCAPLITRHLTRTVNLPFLHPCVRCTDPCHVAVSGCLQNAMLLILCQRPKTIERPEEGLTGNQYTPRSWEFLAWDPINYPFWLWNKTVWKKAQNGKKLSY